MRARDALKNQVEYGSAGVRETNVTGVEEEVDEKVASRGVKGQQLGRRRTKWATMMRARE